MLLKSTSLKGKKGRKKAKGKLSGVAAGLANST